LADASLCQPTLEIYRLRRAISHLNSVSQSIQRHQNEIQSNRIAWEKKPLLRSIYAQFYRRILGLLDMRLSGQTVEIGSGIGNLKAHLPKAIITDLFPNPWLDLVCDGYRLPFLDATLSNLILFDVFHHLEKPCAFLKEASRVLAPQGRLIVFEPYIGLASFPIYAWFHPEPVGWRKHIEMLDTPPEEGRYYAAQGNATRLFLHRRSTEWLAGWTPFHAEAFACFSYLLSGGFTKPSFYPSSWYPRLQAIDARLSRWPGVFGGRCLIGLRRQ
jgi:SAM-dependent methyltransferase